MGLLDKLVRGRATRSAPPGSPLLDQTTFGTGTLGGTPQASGVGSDTATGTGAPVAGEWAAKPPAVPRTNRTAAFVLLVIVVLIVWAIAFSALQPYRARLQRRTRSPARSPLSRRNDAGRNASISSARSRLHPGRQ